MRVLINAISIKEGGSKVVLTRLLAAMCKARPDIEWIVAAHPAVVPLKCNQESIKWLSLPAIGSSALDFIRWYELTLPALAKKYQPDVIFSQTNYLPRRPLKCRTLLLIQNAGYFSAEFDRLAIDSLKSPVARFFWREKGRWIRNSARAASLVTVQTSALADAISAQTGRSRDKIVVINHGPGIAEHRCSMRSNGTTSRIRIGYVTKWGVQKNFQTLFDAVRTLSDAGYDFQLILTLDRDTLETRNVMASARALGIEGLIDNYGEVPTDEIASLYDSLDVFVWPSFCESFGFPAVEAMARGIPIVAARTKESSEVTRGAALEFAPFDASALASHLSKLMNDAAERIKRSKLSLLQSRKFSWDRAARETIVAINTLR